MKKYIRTKTLRVQLMRYHFLIICLIATFVSICTYITANQKTLEVAKNSQKHHVESISYRSRLAYEEMLNIILNCTERKTFDLSGINGGHTSGARKLGLDYAELIRDYCAITEYGNYIVKLSVFDDQGNLVQTGSSFGSTDDAQGIIESGWLDRELEKTMDRYQLDLESSPFSQYEGNILPIARKLEHSGSGGWAVLCLSTDLFKDMLLDTANGQETVIVTAAGDRIASIEEPGEHREENDRIIRSLQEQKKDKGLLEMKVHGKDSLVTYEIYDKSGIMVYETMPLDELSNDRMMIVQTVVIMFLACLIFGLLLSARITKQIKKPIDRLTAHIETIAAGNFIRDDSIEGEDEIGRVGCVVNDMALRIKELMDQQLKAEKEKGDLELKMLQAQINPHFLYNTLDMIRLKAAINKDTEVSQMLMKLVSFYRLSTKVHDSMVTVRKEVDMLDAYMSLMCYRYPEIRYHSDIMPEAMDMEIPNFILQPLLENSLMHGLKDRRYQGSVTLRICVNEQDNSELDIWLSDDGIGIPDDKMEELNAYNAKDSEALYRVQTQSQGDRTHLGVINVISRLKLYYQENAEVIYTRNKTGGTTVKIKIKTASERHE